MSGLCSLPPSLLSQLGVAGVGEGLGPASPPPHPPTPPHPIRRESRCLPSAARVFFPVLGVVRRAGGEGRLVGGASRGWRPLLAGPALCLSRSLPPARRRSEAELPASPSRSRSGRCALSATASLDRDPPPTPRASGPGIIAPRRRQPGVPGRGAPGPRPPDRDRAGPAAARVSLRRRAFRSAAPAE